MNTAADLHELEECVALPAQLLEAERTLWAEVLHQALKDIGGHVSLRGDACAWFRSEEIQVGSLNWICGQIGFDATAVRERILRIHQNPFGSMRARVTFFHRAQSRKKGNGRKEMA